jgi:lysophospholipase L1-like esterase
MSLDRKHVDGETRHTPDHNLIDARLGALGLLARKPLPGQVQEADPTITVAAPNPTSTVTNTQASLYASNPALFRMRGGLFATKTYGPGTVAYVNKPNDPTAPGVFSSTTWSVEVATPGSELEFVVVPYSTSITVRIWVDGRLIPGTLRMGARRYDNATNGISGNASAIVKLAFPTRAKMGKRHVRLECQGAYFRGVNAAKQDQLAPPLEGQKLQSVYWNGDSFTEGTLGATTPAVTDFSIFSSMATIASNLLGWDEIMYGSQGSTGYMAPGSSGRTTIGGRIPDVIACNPDHVVIFAGYNDQGTYSSAQVGAAATQAMQDLRAGLPEVQIWAAGPWALFAPAGATALSFGAAIKSAVEAVDGEYIDMYTLPWITGTGNVAAPPSPLNGNAGLYVASAGDPHPTAEGHEFYGYQIAAAIGERLAHAA